MAKAATLEQVTALAVQLFPTERLRLVEQVVHEMAVTPEEGGSPRRRRSEIRGIVEHPMLGEAAQAWVSCSRAGSDESRGTSPGRRP